MFQTQQSKMVGLWPVCQWLEGEEGVGPGEVEELGSLLGEYTRTREQGRRPAGGAGLAS